jgi:hypothetical protein
MVRGQDPFSTLRIKQYGWLYVIVPLMSYMVEIYFRQGRVTHYRSLQMGLRYVSDERGWHQATSSSRAPIIIIFQLICSNVRITRLLRNPIMPLSI